MPSRNFPDPAVEHGDAGEDVAPGLDQRLEYRDKLGVHGQLSFDDLLGAALNPPTRLPNITPNVLTRPRISFSSRMRMPTRPRAP